MTPDYTKLCTALSGYLDKLPTADTQEAKTTNASIIGRLMASVKMGYYPTDIEHVNYLSRGIEFPENITANLFDPCCGCGIALRTLADGNNCNTYGIELDRHRAEEALTRLNRVGFGSYFRSRVSNEAFHLMLLNPPYLSVMTEGGNNTRSEKRFLVDSISHLLYGGLLIYIIPYYRLTPDVCRILCDNFDDLTVWKFMGEEFKRFRQIAVMGIRRKRRDGSGLAEDFASLALEPEHLPELAELPENRYSLPAREKKVELFKGAEFNVAELAEQLGRSASFSRLFEKNKLDSDVKRPLLPLNLGQVGLIGGSGLINGLVECDTPHIIKGRIVKENNVNREENLNSKGDLTSTTVYETRSNKMIFNLLTPQGFLSLSDYGGEETEDKKDGRSGNSYVPLGRVVITPHAQDILAGMDINAALARHQSGDWGEVSKSDWMANNNALKSGGRILSAYTANGGKTFWIITEADRSHTTVLMPDDY
ncbi:MAG: DUF6094 domain-containing protein, partial [Acetatifactor muris]|nr:DUF6094 domain-containing protein [Acetatifactor muris]